MKRIFYNWLKIYKIGIYYFAIPILLCSYSNVIEII